MSVGNDALIESDGYLGWWKQYGFGTKGLGVWSGVRTSEWKYIEHPTGEAELYNLLSDPDELENLADDPEYTDTKEKFARRRAELAGANQ